MSGVELEATFSSLQLLHTSFNCGNRPFHLVITVAAQGPQGLQALACVSSPPIHVDARKRSKGERPDARAGDVRLAEHKRAATLVRRSSSGSGGGGGAPAPPAPAPPAVAPHVDGAAGYSEAAHPGGCVAPPAAAPALAAMLPHAAVGMLGGGGGGGGLDARFGLDLGAVRLIEATGCTVLLVGLDFTVEAALTAAPFGYSRQQLVGCSLLRILHPDEQVAFVQTVQALVAAAAGLEDVSQSTLRATHRILLPAPAGVGGGGVGGGGGGGGGGVAMRASAVDTAISMVQCPGQPPRLLFSSRYLLPDGSAAAAGAFRVYPARQVQIDAFVGS